MTFGLAAEPVLVEFPPLRPLLDGETRSKLGPRVIDTMRNATTTMLAVPASTKDFRLKGRSSHLSRVC